MKMIMIAIGLLFCLNLYAQTDVIITPSIPTTCRGQDQRPYVNWVYEIENVQENDQNVTFRFKTMYGACDSGRPTPHAVDANVAKVMLWKGGITMPFSKDPYTVSITPDRPGTLQVEVTFNKNKIFKNGRLMRDFAMQFYPTGLPVTTIFPNGAWVQSRVMLFPWKLKLIKHDEFKSGLSLN